MLREKRTNFSKWTVVSISVVAAFSLLLSMVTVIGTGQEAELLHKQQDELSTAADLARTTTGGEINVDGFHHAECVLDLGRTMLDFETAGEMENGTAAFEAARSAFSMFDDKIAAAIAAYQAELRKAMVRTQIASRPGMVGRLFVPSVGIDVALVVPENHYTKSTQPVVDAVDSAMFGENFMGVPYVIADHRNQTFGNLTSIVPGTKAYIETGDDSTTIELVCTAVIDGYNYDVLIRESGEGIAGLATYVCYTCHYDYAQTRRVRFVGWEPC